MRIARPVCVLLALVLLSSGARAQYAADTLSRFKASQLIAPAVLLGSGIGIHYLGHDSVDGAVRSLATGAGLGESSFLDAAGTAVAYGWPALYLGAGLLGAKSKHAFADRVIEATIAYGTTVSVGYVSKRLFKTLRPDGSDAKSFPSGHAALAFTGAELMRLDYGPWWGGAYYALAGGTAVERLFADRHWLSDILAGAGLGILSAHVGAWLLEPVKSLFGIPTWTWDGLSRRPAQVALMPSADPFSGAPMASLAVVF